MSEKDKRYDAKRAGKRARAWTCIVYPESAPDGWIDILREQLVEGLISPLHDKDVEPDKSEPKKAHYHVVISWHSPVSADQAEEIFEKIGGVGCEKVKDFKQMARYLCHLDQPNKHRYNTNDVISIGAIDYQTLVMSGLDEDEMLDEIFDFIRSNYIVSFASFIDLVREYKPEWRRVVYRQYAALISRYIKSMHWEDSRQK